MKVKKAFQWYTDHPPFVIQNTRTKTRNIAGAGIKRELIQCNKELRKRKGAGKYIQQH